MTAPLIAARHLGSALLLGAGLGLFYGFLRPLRQRRTWLADSVFLTVFFWVWLYLSFALCGGDLRLGYTAGLGSCLRQGASACF